MTGPKNRRALQHDGSHVLKKEQMLKSKTVNWLTVLQKKNHGKIFIAFVFLRSSEWGASRPPRRATKCETYVAHCQTKNADSRASNAEISAIALAMVRPSPSLTHEFVSDLNQSRVTKKRGKLQMSVALPVQRIFAIIAGFALAIGTLLLLPSPAVEHAAEQLQPRAMTEPPLSVPETPIDVPHAVEQAGLIETPGVAKQLELFAVHPGPEPGTGRAVLGAAEASSRTYVVGALLENGAKLVQVFDDRAVLVRERRTYTLYLPNQGGEDALAEENAELTVGDFPAPQRALVAPSTRATDVLRPVPAYDGERIVGFSVYPGSRRDQFERWGLQPGDVLVGAGGLLLNEAVQMEAVMALLESGTVLAADIVSGLGERRKVRLDGSALMVAAVEPVLAPAPLQ
jgi:hypothetical protein